MTVVSKLFLFSSRAKVQQPEVGQKLRARRIKLHPTTRRNASNWTERIKSLSRKLLLKE